MARGAGIWSRPALIGLLSSLTLGDLARAQDLPDRSDGGGTSVSQALPAVNFNIPGQPLSTALTAFGTQADYAISVDQGAVTNQQSGGVSGRLPPDEALRRLLAGSGLAAHFTGGRSVFLSRAPVAGGAMQLDPVQVQGVFSVPSQAMIDNVPPPYAGGQVATGSQLGVFGNRSVMDTPFNQTSYTSKKIQDQQATTVFDVLADDPSVRMGAADTSQNGANAWIRGFQAFPSATLYGGLYGMLPYYSTMAELAERVEVLKGPSAMLFGMTVGGGLGGIVNVVPKRAPADTLSEVTAFYASNTHFGGHADIAHRFGSDKQFGVRFNGVFRGGETAVTWNTDQRALAVLGLDFRGESIRLAADLGYQSQSIGGPIPEFGLDNNVPVPGSPNARTAQGSPWGYVQRKDAWAIVRAEGDLSDQVTAFASFGARDNRDQYMLTRSVFITNANGNGIADTGNLSFYFQNLTGSGGLRATVSTGPVTHELAFIATMVRQEFGVGFDFGPSYDTNIYGPSYVPRPGLATPPANKVSVTNLSSVGIGDTLTAADKRIQLTVGARLQQVQSTNFDLTSGAQTSYYDQNAVTPSVGLVLKPFWRNVSLYANYIQGLEQGQVVPVFFANAGQVLPPYVTTQYEAGVKVDWGRFTTTASLFQISRPTTFADVTNNTLVLAGEQRNRGLEFNFFGEVADGVRLLGGLMLLNGVLTKTQDGVNDGWIAPFAPGAQFNIGGEWDLPFLRGLTLTGRITYTASQYIDTTFPRRSLPEWTRLDVGARYVLDNVSPTGKPIALRFGVENLLDTNYWAGGANVSSLFVGAPRTFRLALTSGF